ncbi:MAG: thiamine biosynthesis protein [Candidatus Campylobacter infans]|nr:MAG: thiamine biosynthesis protein [Candidatus Campylobacter infans]
MQVFINSAPITTTALTLNELLKTQGFNLDKIAVECDKIIISRSKWQEFKLQNNMRFEVVSFVAGG